MLWLIFYTNMKCTIFAVGAMHQKRIMLHWILVQLGALWWAKVQGVSKLVFHTFEISFGILYLYLHLYCGILPIGHYLYLYFVTLSYCICRIVCCICRMYLYFLYIFVLEFVLWEVVHRWGEGAICICTFVTGICHFAFVVFVLFVFVFVLWDGVQRWGEGARGDRKWIPCHSTAALNRQLHQYLYLPFVFVLYHLYLGFCICITYKVNIMSLKLICNSACISTFLFLPFRAALNLPYESKKATANFG